MSLKLYTVVVLTSFVLMSCSEDTDGTVSKTTGNKTAGVNRDMSPVKYSQAGRLYKVNCAVCHGKNAEGAKDWRTVDKDGKFPPPPLNGSGHTWHHSPKALALVIREGTGKIGGNMPAWKDKLSNDEIRLILSWITAQWPDEIYTAWYNQHYQQN